MAKNRLKRCEREEGESARSRPSNSASNSHSNSNSSLKEKENENPKKKRRVLKLMHARAYRELWLGTRPKIPKLSEVKMIESPSEKPKEALKEASVLIVDHPLVHFDLEINKDDEINACLFCNAPPTGDLLFCEGKDCNKRCHVSCFDSSLKKPPAGAWFCVPCVQRKIQFGSHAASKGPESIWDVKEGKYFVKYKSLAHVHNKWLSEAEILQEAPQIISKFNSLISKEKAPKWKKEWTEPQRILKTRSLMPPKTAEGFFANNKTLRFCNEEFLVKWRGLGYEKATWELESFICWRTGEARNLLRELEARRQLAKDVSDPCFVLKALEVKEKPLIKLDRLPAGTKNDCLISINKIREFWHGSKNTLLIDEQRIMKTVLFIQSVIKNIWRPILIISNENSISLWESELQRFEPRINTVTYTGTKKERDLIQDLEFYEEGSNCVMVQVLISHPDAILEDFETIDCFGWGAVIIDEFKSSEISKKLDKLIKISTDFKLLLSSSPLYDEISEYSQVLSYLDPFNTDVKQTKNKNQALEMLKERLKNLVIHEQKHNFQEDSMDLIESVYGRRKAVILQKHKKETLKIEKYKEREKMKNKENSKLMSEFEIHVKRQYERLEEFYVGVRNSEERQKDQWIEKAKLGELEESFDNVPFFGFFSIEPFNWACKNEEIIEARNDKDMGNEETGSRNTVIEETGNGKTVNGEEMMNEETGNANVELTSQQKEADATEPVITPLAVEETVTGRETASEQVVNENAMDIDTETRGHTASPDLVEESCNDHETVKNDVVNESMRNGNEELVNDDKTQMVEETVNGRETVNEQVLNESAMDTNTEMVEIQNGEPSVKETGDDTTPTIIEETGDEIVKNDVVNESMRSGNEELVNDETQTVQCEETVIGEMVNNEERVNNEEIKERISTEEMVNNEERVNNEEIKERVSTEERVNNEEIKERVSTEERVNNEEIKERVSTEEMVNNEEIKERVNNEEICEAVNNEGVLCEEIVNGGEIIEEERVIDKTCDDQGVKNDSVNENATNGSEKLMNDETQTVQCEADEPVNNEEIIIEEIVNEGTVKEGMVNNQETVIDKEKGDDVLPDTPIDQEAAATSDHSEPTRNELIKKTSNNQEMINEREVENEDLMNIDQDQTSPTEINFVIETLNGPQIININMENQNGEEMVRTEMENPVALNNGVNSHGEMIEAIDETVINKEMVIDPVDEETAIEEAVNNNEEAVTGNTVNGVTVIEGLVVIEEDEDVLPVDQGTELTIPQIPIPCTNGNSPAPINTPDGAMSAPIHTPAGTTSAPINMPAGTISAPIHTPAGTMSAPINTPAPINMPGPINTPSGATSAPINTPAGATSAPINVPAGTASDPINTPDGTMSAGLRDPMLTQPALSQTQILLDASNSFSEMVLSPDPLKNELMRIKHQTETLLRAYQHKKMRVKTEFEEEMARVRRKYEDLEREAELEFQVKKKWINEIYQKLRENLSLAEQFHMLYLGQQQQTSISSFLQVQGRSQVPLPVPLHVQPYQQQINTSQNQTLRQFGTQSFSVPTSSSLRPAGVSTGEDLSFSFPPVLDQRGLFANISSTSQGTTNGAPIPILRHSKSQTPPVQAQFNPPVCASTGDLQSRSIRVSTGELCPCTNQFQTQFVTEKRSPAPHLVFRPAGGATTSSSTAELATNQRFSARQLRNFLGIIRAQELPQSSSGGNFGNDWRNLNASFGGNDGSNGRNGGNDRNNGDVAGSDRFGG